MSRLQIHVADEVREQLSAAEVEAILDGRAIPTVYECQICRESGDARLEATNAVLWVGMGVSSEGPPDAMLALVHGACGPSEVRLIEEWAAMPHGDDAFEEQKPLTLVSLVMGADGHPWASLTLQPGTTTRCVGDGEVLDFEYALRVLIEEGWGDRMHDVPVVEGWRVHVDPGELIVVRRANEDYWRAPRSTQVPDHWLQAARDRGEILVLLLPPASLRSSGDYYDVLTRLEARGELAVARITACGRLGND